MRALIEIEMATAGKVDDAELGDSIKRAIGVITSANLGAGTKFALRAKDGAELGTLRIADDRPTKEEREAKKAAKEAKVTPPTEAAPPAAPPAAPELPAPPNANKGANKGNGAAPN